MNEATILDTPVVTLIEEDLPDNGDFTSVFIIDEN